MPQISPGGAGAPAQRVNESRGVATSVRRAAAGMECLRGARGRARTRRAHVRIVGEPREARPHLVDGGLDELQEGGVVLHAVDEHEAAGVLELALDRHEIELPTERGPLRGVEPALPRIVVQPRLHEGPVEDLVAVVEQRDEVVDARPRESVLEVEPAEPLAGADHQVA